MSLEALDRVAATLNTLWRSSSGRVSIAIVHAGGRSVPAVLVDEKPEALFQPEEAANAASALARAAALTNGTESRDDIKHAAQALVGVRKTA